MLDTLRKLQYYLLLVSVIAVILTALALLKATVIRKHCVLWSRVDVFELRAEEIRP